MKEQPSKEERKRLLIEMMREDEKNGMYEESQEEKLIKLINLYWTFDDNQRHTHSWHDKQDCIKQIRTHFHITSKP